MLLPIDEENNVKLKLLKEEDITGIIEVKEKLHLYLLHNHTAKDQWLLSCHAHCFICLS